MRALELAFRADSPSKAPVKLAASGLGIAALGLALLAASVLAVILLVKLAF